METLADRIARDGPVNELDAVGWAIRLAKRLEALHALGVAHGSVSPACVVTHGVERTAKAYLVDVQRTPSMPPFQSPERIAGGELSPADDTWAVAATLYTALTGKGPFEGATEVELRQKILAASPAPLAVYDVGDDDLQHILDHAFAREISARTVTVIALRRALEEWHPDPNVGALLPLDDEESSFDGDDADTKTVARPKPTLSRSGPNIIDDKMRSGAVAMPAGLGAGRRVPSPLAPSPAVTRLAEPAIAILSHDSGPFAPAAPSLADAGSEKQLASQAGSAAALPAFSDPMRPFGPPGEPPGASGASTGTLLAASGGVEPIAAAPGLAGPRSGLARSSRGLLLAAVLVLIVAAALTFALLRYGPHGLLG